MNSADIINLPLFKIEWYFLHIQLTKLRKIYPDNPIIKDIFERLEAHKPELAFASTEKLEFPEKYECKWVDVSKEV